MYLISLILSGLAVAVLTAEDCTVSHCNTGLMKYYKELNCTPVQEDGACCPSKFDCTAAFANLKANECHLKGRSYDLGTTLDSKQLGDVCIPHCRCGDSFEGGVNFQCISGECGDLFSGPLEPGCVYLYTKEECCFVGTHCKNNTNPTAKEDFKCQHGEASYVVGERFWPKEKPCLSCICQKEYDGTLNGPWCSEIDCGIELHYGSNIKKGCAPIHFGKNDCCPIGFRCPASSDSVAKRVPAAKNDAPQCVFGELQLNVGETLNLHNKCTTCTCDVPPHVSCVQEGYNC